MDIQQAFKEVTGLSVEEGIEKAIEGGYHRGQIGTSPIVEINCDFAITETKGERNHYGLAWVWLDPLFWQSLGKAMGWKKYWCVLDREYERNDEKCDGYTEEQEAWKDYQHSFIDALAE